MAEYSNFFSKLKLVCRNIEQGISQLQKEVETKTSSRSSGNAVMKLTSLKQEIQNMKAEGRQKCQTLDEEGQRFEELMACCRSLIDIQSHKHRNIEIFMKQYGYKDYKAKEEIKEDQSEMTDELIEEETKENQQPVTPPQKKKPSRVKTPKPEDFGFSTYTLRAMERGFSTMQQDFKTSFVPHSEATIPPVFNEDAFVSLTPSVFGRHVPFHTPGKYQEASPSFQDFLTPADKKLNCEEKYGSNVTKLNFEEYKSPDTPIFETPGMKLLGKNGNFDKVPAPVSALNSILKSRIGSPQVPAFQSESVKKLMSKSTEPESNVKTSRAKLYDDLPQTPEFTFNIKKLQEISELSTEPKLIKKEYLNTNKEPTPPTFQFKGTTMPSDFQPLASRLGHDISSNITPPMPEMLSDRHSKYNSTSKQQIRDLSKTPPTPKFLSKFVNDLVQNKNN